jgi:molybdenum cofactor synthesis domain-containing protein
MSENLRRPTVCGVIIGDEILSGEIQDDNSRFLIETVRASGARLLRLSLIGDIPEVIGREVAFASELADHVVTSGGVGPTHDDCTMEAIASAFDSRLVRHPRLEQLVQQYYGPQANEAALRMANIPEGAHLLEMSSYPLVVFRNIYILPGVPKIFRAKLTELAQARFAAPPITIERLYFNCDECDIAAPLTALQSSFPTVHVGSYPRTNERYRVLVVLESADDAMASAAAQNLLQSVASEWVYTQKPCDNDG